MWEDAVQMPAEAAPGQAMHGKCAIPECRFIAEIVVSDPAGDELDVCRGHWHDALDRSSGLIHGIRLIRQPRCFLSGCDSLVAVVIEDGDGLPRPVCAGHWSDLECVVGTSTSMPRRRHARLPQIGSPERR